jgi:hypothetical protein
VNDAPPIRQRTVCRPDHERDKLCLTRDQGLTQMSCGWLSMIGYVAELQERHATQHFRFGHRRFGNEFGFLSSSAFPPAFG